jgi:uracil-DNA glycosylase
LAQLHPDALLLVIGAYALKRHLPQNPYNSLGETVRNFADFMPHAFPLPHPSPRNRAVLSWDWFSAEVLPALKREVQARF